MSALQCICCNRGLDNILEAGIQPDNGLEFITYGHYGSTVFDPMGGAALSIVVCDECLRIAGSNGRVWETRTAPQLKGRGKVRTWAPPAGDEQRSTS